MRQTKLLDTSKKAYNESLVALGREQPKVLIGIIAILFLFIGFSIGSAVTLYWAAGVGVRLLEQMHIVVDIPQSELVNKIVQHLNLLP